MKRLKRLWDRFISFENLHLAYRKARLGKLNATEVARFALRAESELLRLRDELACGTYAPLPYRLFRIYERKPRTIAAAAFRDRVVHHACLNVMGPPLARRFIADTYANRVGKGTHAAVRRYQQWARRYAYAMKLDIRGYFPSVDHQWLKHALRRRINDERFMALLDLIIDASPCDAGRRVAMPDDDMVILMERRAGIPIGNLTSQFFAEVYLDDFDHFVKESLRVRAYLRYVDDMVFLSDHKETLWAWRSALEHRLAQIRLRIHAAKGGVLPTRMGLDLLGYRVYPWRTRLRNDNGFRFRRRLRKLARDYANGSVEWSAIQPRVQSWIGHAQQADTVELRRSLFADIVFTKGGRP